MEEIIFKSDAYFCIIDYHLSHRKLLLRATIVDNEKESFYNVDILCTGVDFLHMKSSFQGLEIKLNQSEKYDKNGNVLVENSITRLGGIRKPFA